MKALQNANFVNILFICNMQQKGRNMLKNISWPIKKSNTGICFFNFLDISLKQGGTLSLPAFK